MIQINKLIITDVFQNMKNQDKAASFITKLYNILKSKQHCKAITWDSQLKGIRILNQKRLQEAVLPRYFRHNRFPSFVRQLNMYDFHKIHLGDHKSIFCHEIFDPKDKQTIYQVKRKVNPSPQNTDKVSSECYPQTPIEEKKQQISSLKSLIPSEKQNVENIWSQQSSFKLFKNSLKGLSDRKSQSALQTSHLSEQQVIQELVKQVVALNLSAEQKKKKIRKYQKMANYKKFLKNKQFKMLLYQRLGLQFGNQKQNLSQLSIEGQLLIPSRKNTTEKSLKMLESGPINFRDTIGCLMNL